MQHSPHEIKEKLLKALDKDNNVVDMCTVMEVITILEKIQITKEALEKTRLGKYINDLRKKTTNDTLARRAKKLVRSWRKLIIPENAVNGEKTIQVPTAVAPNLGLNLIQTNKSVSPAMTNHRLHRNRSNSPVGVCSPMDSYCSSTSTSPALVVSHQGSRPGTPSVFAPKTKITSPEKDYTTSSSASVPSFNRQLSPCLNAMTQPKSNSLNDMDHNLQRHPQLISNAENNFHKPTKHKPKMISPTPPSALSTNDKVICSSHSLNVDVVARTNAANKRLRKETEDDIAQRSPSKKMCGGNSLHRKYQPTCATNSGIANGVECGDSNDSSHSIQEDFQDETKVPSESSAVAQTVAVALKKGDKNSKVKREASDSLKEKLATHARTHKVKTTAQLIEALKLNAGVSSSLNVSSILPCQGDMDKASSSRASPGFGRRSANNVLGGDHDMTKTKTELMEKFLLSSAESPDSGYGKNACSNRSDLLKPESLISKSGAENVSGPSYIEDGVDPVEAILATLPPINPEEIDWGDDHKVVDGDDEAPPKTETITDAVIAKLHTESWDGMNGNYDHEQKFREWHEALSRRSYNNDLLHILPYVNTD